MSGKHSNFLPLAAAEAKCSCRKMAGHLFGYWVAFDKVIKLHQKRLVPERLFYVALVVVDSCAIGPSALFALWSSCRHHLLSRDQWRVICLIRLGNTLMKSFNVKFEWELPFVLVALPLFTERLYRIRSPFPLNSK